MARPSFFAAHCRLAAIALWGLTATAAAAPESAETRETFFESRIRPVLATTCFKCHGGEKTSNNLRVDSRQALLRGGDSGAAIVVSAPEKSLLLRALRHVDDDLKMPPDSKLPDSVIADFKRWIKDGAAWPIDDGRRATAFRSERHWSFRPVRKVEPPIDPTGWSNSAVDRFIRAAQAKHRLNPPKSADRRTLLRRVYFDVVGLPPTPEAMARHLADDSPGAFDKVVDELLASPQYGERWGRYWMDVVRYADTAGDNADYPVPEARLYRDYIIDSLNADKPYDAFVREQVAGDLLAGRGPADRYAERVVATGFLALSRRYATAPYELWHLTLEDTIDTVGRAFLGITLRCARCHDHKFDPVTMRDYYALYGVFASTQFPYAGSEEFQSMKFGRRDFSPLLSPTESGPLMRAYGNERAALAGEITRSEQAKPRSAAERRRLDSLRDKLRVLDRRGAPEALPVAYAVREGQIADARIQLRGEPGRSGDAVPRGVPGFLAGVEAAPPGPADSGRLQLAQWLTSPKNPLTARVLVNRVWQHHFGKGIVATPSNFGTRGGPPSHPELLDWLAARFMEDGWSLKSLHRLILTSRTYQLSSASDPTQADLDPLNQFYWRFDRQRLDAEATRDALLSVSGELDLNRPGAHPFPPIGDWHWTQHNPFRALYETRHRSVYLMTQRLHRHAFLALFDGPDPNTTTDVRSSSTVPLQALFLMNSDFMARSAGAFARRLGREADDPSARIRRAFELAYARPARSSEVERGRTFLAHYADEAGRTGLDATQAAAEAWRSYARTLLAANEFVYVD